MNISALTTKDRLIILGNLIIAILLTFASAYLVTLVNSHIFASILAVVIAMWLWVVFGVEYNAAG